MIVVSELSHTITLNEQFILKIFDIDLDVVIIGIEDFLSSELYQWRLIPLRLGEKCILNHMMMIKLLNINDKTVRLFVQFAEQAEDVGPRPNQLDIV